MGLITLATNHPGDPMPTCSPGWTMARVSTDGARLTHDAVGAW